ncbi:carbohydrate ABC transporter permease [Treponema phagedenis]|uniref:carbohydrate ABC transporter permease n=1 Tax=Treponema phagedenis TaxID=162 RepID=UPI0001F64338|nr:carbohydrate ABC transporter permease [Treponema phagedenis]EFW38764.1 ABC transporter, permease protein [Treponema phagedenis F0421]TYT78706.1 carbohydrate ABC transporter permease [Treponema phagedenis]
MKKGKHLWLLYVLLIIVSAISLFPFVWTFIAATHDSTEIFKISKTFIPGKAFIDNYNELVKFSPIMRNLWNSFFIAALYTALLLIIDSLAGYAFAKLKFKGKDILFFICLCSLFIPQQVTLVPLFIQLNKMSLLNTAFGVILPGLGGIFGVFLMRQNFFAFPDDIIEAATIDGAGMLLTFATIVLPSMRPALASLGILSFVNQWGSYLWPLIVLNERANFTIPLVLALMVAPGQVVNYGSIMVGAVIALVPVLIFFLLFQKHFINGMLSAAVKG